MIFSLHRVKADKFELIMSMREMLHEKCQEFLFTLSIRGMIIRLAENKLNYV